MAPINLGINETSPAAEVVTNVLFWLGTILVFIFWLGLSTAAVAYLAFIGGRCIHSHCGFKPVVHCKPIGPELPHKEEIELYAALNGLLYGMVALVLGIVTVADSKGDLKLIWLQVLLVALGLQGV